MKTIKILLGLFLACFSAVAQKEEHNSIDSVIKQYEAAHLQGKTPLVIEASGHCKSLIADYEKNHDSTNLVKAKILLGQMLVYYGKPDTAKKKLTEAFALANITFGIGSDEAMKAKKYLAESYGKLGEVYESIDSIKMEMRLSKEVLATYEKSKNDHTLDIADLKNTIGLDYGALNDRKMEKMYLNEAQLMLENYVPEKKEENIKIQEKLMNVYNSLSQSYSYSLDFENTILYARKSLQISSMIAPRNPQRAPAMVALARGLYALNNDCGIPIQYIDSALALIETAGLIGRDAWLSYRSYKMNMLVGCKKADEVKALADSTIKTMLEMGSPDEALNQLLILNQNNNIEKQAVDIQKENKAIQKRNQERLFAITIIALLVISAGASIALLNNRKKKREIQLQKTELERQIFENSFLSARMDYHFVSNCVTSAKSMIDKNEIDNTKNYLDKLDFSLRDIVNNSAFSLVSLSSELISLGNYLELEKPRIENGLEWVIIVDTNVDTEDIELPTLLLQPFVENAIKHGVNGIDRKGVISIGVKKIDKRLHINIDDNGRGIKSDKMKSKSKGLELTAERLKMFSKLNNAEARFEVQPLAQGTRVIISFNIQITKI